MKRNQFVLAVALISATCLSTSAFAGSPGSTVAARESNFKAIGKAFKVIRDQTGTPAPDINAIRASANTIAALAPKVGSTFPKGSGPESGVKTHALAAIWEKPQEFNAALAKLMNGSRAMQAAAASGSIDQVKATIPVLGGACKGCHDQFKARD
jgi:cytochrome c556